jgi:hypothetical protein
MTERLKEGSKVMLQDFDAIVEYVPGAHPASCTIDNGSFLGVKQLGSGNDHPLPSELSFKNRAIPLLPLWDFVVCSRVKFTVEEYVI